MGNITQQYIMKNFIWSPNGYVLVQLQNCTTGAIEPPVALYTLYQLMKKSGDGSQLVKNLYLRRPKNPNAQPLPLPFDKGSLWFVPEAYMTA